MTIVKKLSPQAEAQWQNTYGKPVVIFGMKRPPTYVNISNEPKDKKK